MPAQKTRLKGYSVTVKDGDEITEIHYVVNPNGTVLSSSGHDWQDSRFGPKNSDDWGQSSTLPECAVFVGFFYIHIA